MVCRDARAPLYALKSNSEDMGHGREVLKVRGFKLNARGVIPTIPGITWLLHGMRPAHWYRSVSRVYVPAPPGPPGPGGVFSLVSK